MGRCVRTRVKSAEVASDGCYWAVNDFKEACGKTDLDNVGCRPYHGGELARNGHEQVHMANVGKHVCCTRIPKPPVSGVA